MVLKRLTTTMLAIVLAISCYTSSRAEEAAPAQIERTEEAAPPQNEPDGGAVAGAVVSDLIYVPGKVLTCVLGGAFWTGAMVVTFGTIYKKAGDFAHDACTGKWVVRGADMMDSEETTEKR